MSLISAEAMALIERVEAARAEFMADGLSAQAADILIGLDVWRPMSLIGQFWEDGPERPGLGNRIAACPGGDGPILDELRAYWSTYQWPD